MSRWSQIASFKAPVRPLDVFDIRDFLKSFYNTPDLLWVSGDGNTPTIGPSMTSSGTITTGSDITLANGEKVQSDTFTNARRCTVSTLDPGLGEDFVVFLVGIEPSGVASNRVWFSTRNAGQRGFVNISYPSNFIFPTLVGDSAVNSDAFISSPGNAVAMLMIANRAGNVTFQISATPSTGVAVPTGSWGAGNGFCVGDVPAGGISINSDIAFVSYWKGAGIAGDWDASRVTSLYSEVGV